MSLKIAAQTTGGTATPNFGREASPESFTIAVTKAPDMALAPKDATLSGTFGAISGGTASTSTAHSIDEVGVYTLTPGVLSGNYLGGGSVVGTAFMLGRIVPDHFDTAATGPMTTCRTNMGCDGLSAAYAGQNFSVTVTAKNAAGVTTENYEGLLYAHSVTLSAFNAAGASGAANQNPPSQGGVLTTVSAGTFTKGEAVLTAKYAFPIPYSSTTPRGVAWTPPTTIHIRAEDTKDKDSPLDVTSLRTGAVETGVRIVNGRLNVPSRTTSELLVTPLVLRAQYYTGTMWEDSTLDSASVFTPSLVTVSNCQGAFASNCSLSVATSGNLTMSNGTATMRLNAPGSGRTGGVSLRLDSPAWLPSTLGRLVFGTYRPPLDYIREVY
jgi:hypothetical protein